MKISFYQPKEGIQEFEVKHLSIQLNEDTEIKIDINQFGELVINKQSFGKGNSSLSITPSVSNEIKIS
jgi:hypothetical protein